jgi:hypothetical protein
MDKVVEGCWGPVIDEFDKNEKSFPRREWSEEEQVTKKKMTMRDRREKVFAQWVDDETAVT